MHYVSRTDLLPRCPGQASVRFNDYLHMLEIRMAGGFLSSSDDPSRQSHVTYVLNNLCVPPKGFIDHIIEVIYYLHCFLAPFIRAMQIFMRQPQEFSRYPVLLELSYELSFCDKSIDCLWPGRIDGCRQKLFELLPNVSLHKSLGSSRSRSCGKTNYARVYVQTQQAGSHAERIAVCFASLSTLSTDFKKHFMTHKRIDDSCWEAAEGTNNAQKYCCLVYFKLFHRCYCCDYESNGVNITE